MEFLKDIWEFVKYRKKYWLLPIIFVLLLFDILIVIGGGGGQLQHPLFIQYFNL